MPLTWFDVDVPKLSIDLDHIASWVMSTSSTEKKSEKRSIPGIRNVYFNNKTGHTTIVWDDGSEATVVKCGSDEKFEPYAGFCAAITKKLFGSTPAAKKVMDKYDVEKAKAAKEEERLKKAAERRAQEARNHERKIRSMMKRISQMREAENLLFDKETKNLFVVGDTDGDKTNE